MAKLNRAGNRRGMSEGSRKTQFKAKTTATKSTAKSGPQGPLNKAGNRRGMSAGSRKSQFMKAEVIKQTHPSARTPQQRVQARKLRISDKGVAVEGKGRSVQDMIDDVMSMNGASVKKALVGMAQKLNASASDIARIAAADDSLLEKVYRDNKLTFEAYWEYPIIGGETRGDTLDEILAMVGV